jgi:hypothetical protein
MTGTASWKSGGCHCGAVALEVLAPDDIEVSECNCSICAKAGYLHLIVPKDRFRLIRGEDALTNYAFNTRTAKHMFCRTCGIKSFYVPRSHPDGISVNARCLAPEAVTSIKVVPFNGRMWEESIGILPPLEGADG